MLSRSLGNPHVRALSVIDMGWIAGWCFEREEVGVLLRLSSAFPVTS